MLPTVNESGLLIVTALRPWGGKRRDRYDFGVYMSEYFKLKNAVRKHDTRFQMTSMFLFRQQNESIEDTMKASLDQFFEPNPLNLGYHPVDPLSDALPTVTLAIVNRGQITRPNLHRVNSSALVNPTNWPGIVPN